MSAVKTTDAGEVAYSFTSSNFKDLGGETNWTFDSQLLVFGSVDEVRRD